MPVMIVMTVNSIPVGVFSDLRSTQTTKAFCTCIIWVYSTCINVILCVPIFMKCAAEQRYVQISYIELHSCETV